MSEHPKGRLILIGCGPGSVDLLTTRAIRRIAEAEIILCDRLVNPEVLQFASSSATVLDVGKVPGDGGTQQSAINEAIAQALAAGRTVARLKSGDPMVFGRASEEIAVATAAGAEIEIVPGVTAALAAAADAELAVTERAEVQTFSIVTGRTADDARPDWAGHLRPGACIAIYMGVAQAWRIQSALMSAGAPAACPCEWVENAGRPDTRSIPSRLDRLSLDANLHDVRNPAVLFVRYPFSLASEVVAKAEAS